MSVNRPETGFDFKVEKGQIEFDGHLFEDFSIPLSSVLEFLKRTHLKESKKAGLARFFLETTQKPFEDDFIGDIENALDIDEEEVQDLYGDAATGKVDEEDRKAHILIILGELYDRDSVNLTINAVTEALTGRPFSQIPGIDQMAVERELDKHNIKALRDSDPGFPY